jgi:hypothetical protein
MVKQSAGGLLIGSTAYFLNRRRQLAALAARYVAVVLPVASSVPELEYFPIQVKRMLRRFSYLKAGPSLCP